MGCKMVGDECQPRSLSDLDLVECIGLGEQFTYQDGECVDCSQSAECSETGCTLEGAQCVSERPSESECLQGKDSFYV